MSVSWKGPAVVLALFGCFACAKRGGDDIVLTFPASAVGAEAAILDRQLEGFMRTQPGVVVHRQAVPDSADARHQLYVQWLNARTPDPDVLQLDVVWTAEFAAAGWILPLSRFQPATDDYFAAARRSSTWQGKLYALPWFVDVGMLYWRTDLVEGAPGSFDELSRLAAQAMSRGDVDYGLVWQGARYEGLTTVFLEYLGAFGGRILDDAGHVVVDSEQAVRALETMTAAVPGLVPRAALAWHEEECRLAFQNGRALFMRNWPYAYALLEQPSRSAVAGRFAVAPMPAGDREAGGRSTAALGGSLLAINAASDAAEAAWELVAYLAAPERMAERARATGQFPARRSLYEHGRLEGLLPVAPALARRLIENARPRPATPIYAELSAVLQVYLHRALSGQLTASAALAHAAAEMRALLVRAGLTKESTGPAS